MPLYPPAGGGGGGVVVATNTQQEFLGENLLGTGSYQAVCELVDLPAGTYTFDGTDLVYNTGATETVPIYIGPNPTSPAGAYACVAETVDLTERHPIPIITSKVTLTEPTTIYLSFGGNNSTSLQIESGALPATILRAIQAV